MNRVVIGIGSNVDPGRHIQRAMERLGAEHRIVAVSAFVETKPLGVKNQPNFLNGAALLETEMDTDGLKAWLLRLESELGRVRTADKCGPRTIDLDIVVWNGKIVHKDVRRRDFLRRAILEVAPDLAL